jgi:hypothetical protein
VTHLISDVQILNLLKKPKIISENDREVQRLFWVKKVKTTEIIPVQNPRYIILEIKYLLRKKKKIKTLDI